MKTLGERIRELREQRDLSLRELASQIGVSAAFMSDVELGRRNPSDKHMKDIARTLLASLDDLREFDTRPPLQELRRATLTDPQMGFAFRRMMDEGVSSEELLDFLERRDRESQDEGSD
ncbi:MAG: helix-turn-helix transcriptional regulator [Chloroflexi bacterium]|nr:helix-turn-helix transcriptional regulator [Chloroflexota bacterium]MYI05396.1 helix-turn-helix transcriptional regulator [Chloroflexota bacterium]